MLRRWPNIKPTLFNVSCLLGSLVYTVRQIPLELPNTLNFDEKSEADPSLHIKHHALVQRWPNATTTFQNAAVLTFVFQYSPHSLFYY